MHGHSGLVCFVLTLIIVIIHARNIRFDFVDPVDEEYNLIEQPKQLSSYNRNLYQSPSFTKKLFSFMTGEPYYPYEHERSSAFARRPKAIVKGDPREFMG